MRYVIPPASSGSVLGSPPSWSCLECTQEASYQTPNHLIWLHPTWRSSSSIPRSVWIFLTHSGVIRSAEKEMEHFREYGPNLWNQTWVVRSRGKVWWPGLVPWDLAKKNIGTQPGKTTWSYDLVSQPSAAKGNRTWCNLCRVAGEGEDLGILTPGIAYWFQVIDTHVFSNGTYGTRLYLYARYWSANPDMSEEDVQQRDLVKIKINQFW